MLEDLTSVLKNAILSNRVDIIQGIAMHINHSKATIFRKDLEAVLETMLTDRFGPSKERHVREFEKELLTTLNLENGVVLNSGTAAMHMALIALGLQAGDEIIIPTYAEPSILHAANYVGAVPILADINHNNFTLSLEETKKRINEKTKAIYIPHLFGFPADITKFQELNIPIIEDITDALGGEFKGQKTGQSGTLAVASFSDEKMITTGQGGAVFSSNKKMIADIKHLLNYKEMDAYSIKYNYKLSDLLAALGINQLKFLDKFIEKRQVLANEYDKHFTKNGIEYFTLVVDRYNTYFRYIITLKGNLQKTIQYLKKHKVDAEEPIKIPLHRLLSADASLFPNTEMVWHRSLSLPIYPTMKKSDVEKVAGLVCKSLF